LKNNKKTEVVQVFFNGKIVDDCALFLPNEMEGKEDGLILFNQMEELLNDTKK